MITKIWDGNKFVDYDLNIKKDKEDEQRQSRNNNNSDMDLEKCRETISITAPDGTIYEFEKPEFECELFKCVDNFILGVVYDFRANKPLVQSWDLATGNGSNYLIDNCSNLIPIKKKWYEYPENFPALMIEGATGKWFVIEFEEQYYDYCDGSDRLATKEEVMSLYWKDKK